MRSGLYTLAALAVVGLVALVPGVNAVLVLAAAVVLAALLAVAEATESGRARRGAAEVARTHLVPGSLGVGGAALAVVAGLVSPSLHVTRGAAIAGVIAATVAVVIVLFRVRPRQRP